MRKKKPTNESLCLRVQSIASGETPVYKAGIASKWASAYSTGERTYLCNCANVLVQSYKCICAIVKMNLCNCTNVFVQWHKCICAIVLFQLCRVICATQWPLFEHMCLLALSTCSSSLSSARCTWPFAPQPLNLPLCELWKFWPSLKIY